MDYLRKFIHVECRRDTINYLESKVIDNNDHEMTTYIILYNISIEDEKPHVFCSPKLIMYYNVDIMWLKIE